MKKLALLIIILSVFCFQNKAFSQSCEKANSFNSAFKNLSKTESNIIKQTSENIVTSFSNLIKAINDETLVVLNSLQKYAIQRVNFIDAVNKLQVIRDRQTAQIKDQLKRSPDFNDINCAKATNNKNWEKVNHATYTAKKIHTDGFLSSTANEKNPIKKTESTIDKHIDWFTNITNEDEETNPNPFANADINASSLFEFSTFKPSDYKGTIPSSEEMPDTLIAAQQFTRNLTGNENTNYVSGKDILNSSKGYQAKTEQIKDVSRKAFTFSVFADSLAKRTSFAGTNTGKNLRANYIKLNQLAKNGNGEGGETSVAIAETIQDDISEQEFKEHMYYKMYTNPDWVTSLERTPAQLKQEELDIVNKRMGLEWDSLLMLEKLATVDSVNLAATLDKQR